MRGLVGAWTVGAMMAWGCGGTTTQEPRPPVGTENPARTEPPPPTGGGQPPGVITPPNPGNTTPPGGTPPGGTKPGGTTPPAQVTVGPWPNEPVVNYSQRYGLGQVRAMAVDDAYNLWLLDGDRIGVLRPGDTTPRWTSGVGQAAPGFGPDKLALGSTVICGGSAGRAYVGYATYELSPAFIYSPDGRHIDDGYTSEDPTRFDPIRYEEYKKGDLDVVRLEPDGRVVLEEHLSRSATPNGPQDIGIRNTNDHHFDEDRSVLTCVKVMRGKHRGDLYIGTNHGVTRIRDLTYNSHRHPVWFKTKPDGGKTQMAGYTYAVGIAPNGDVLIGNDWNVGVVTPSERLADWDRVNDTLNPEKLNAFIPELNSVEEKDFWRGIQQTTDGRYYVASKDFGLWQMSILRRSEAKGVKVAGLPTDELTSLAATDDGSLFIGTDGAGLWRLDASKQLVRVSDVDGNKVEQLLYDPTVKPAMLYVLTDRGLTVLRGH
ncbi:MAG TPA: hypothetical protein VF794_32655 [Archangium sp.]|uniref:hypothetical protein n=1 Tax=Archangium sp. TaxID=1872627 RepID=UPI002EDA313B